MAIAIVQEASNATNGAASLTATFGSTPTDGNLLVAMYFCKSDAGVTKPTGWSIGVTVVNATEADTGEISYKVAASDSTAVTITPADAVSATALKVYEVSGITSAVIDKTNSTNRTSANSIQTGSTGVLSASDEIIFACSVNRASPAAPGVDSGFTLAATVGSGDGLGNVIPASLIVSATTAQNPTFSWTSSAICMALIASFMASGGGGGGGVNGGPISWIRA